LPSKNFDLVRIFEASHKNPIELEKFSELAKIWERNEFCLAK